MERSIKTLIFLASASLAFAGGSAPKAPAGPGVDFLRLSSGPIFVQFRRLTLPETYGGGFSGGNTQDTTWAPSQPFWGGSFAWGREFSDRISLFVSGEWLPNDYGLLANLRYRFPLPGPFSSYFYGGLGPALSDLSPPPDMLERIGLAAQGAIGLDFRPEETLGFYIEARSLLVFDFWSASAQWMDGYTAVLYAGVETGL